MYIPSFTVGSPTTILPTTSAFSQRFVGPRRRAGPNTGSSINRANSSTQKILSALTLDREPRYTTKTNITATWTREADVQRTERLTDTLSSQIIQTKEECRVCMETEIDSCLSPCGHLCAYVSCAKNFKVCLICRREVKGVIKTWKT